MKEILQLGELQCVQGEKVQGMYTFANTDIVAPVTLINGHGEGRMVLITSGIHGGEYPSIEAVIELASELQPNEIQGSMIIFHPVNVEGFLDRASGVYPPSKENLNRQYPGTEEGTIGQRFAYALTNDIIKRCDFMIDTHGGDLHEQLPPYVYYPGVGDEDIVERSRQAASVVTVKYMVKSQCCANAYHMCNGFGIPSLLLEMGGKGLWSQQEVEDYKSNIINLLRHVGVIDEPVIMPEKEAYVITNAAYIDATHSGCWYPLVELEEYVKQGQLIGVIKDFFGNILEEVYAEFDALILFNTVSLAIRAGDPIITYGI
ncbi:MAG: succinylglutamate desuccinylase/aspartoacylase family protein [Eubacteriales bacterium]